MNQALVSLCAAARQIALGVCLAATAVAASAQAPETDPPGRVGRLSELNGQVWLYTPESGEWTSATRNRPFTGGERLSTESGARAELRIGSMALRLDGGTELEAVRIDDDRVELQLHSGSVGARFGSRETVREFALRTGEGAFRVNRTGRYRFDRRDETSHLTVYGGEAVYEGPRSALTVYSGQRAEFWVDSNGAAQYAITDPQRDDFAAWNTERDRADERSASARYVSPEMTGVEDLDRYGRWQQDEEHGAIWVPREVSPGWAPYSNGHWAWVSPWGWTWVDDAPWGFAPFHYGRWVHVHNHWGWAPGRRVLRPVYAPALVGWIGGPHVSLAVSIGAGPVVGWFPLAPREVYVPSYRVSPRYVRDVNITHVTNITNITNIVNQPPRDGRGDLVNNQPQDKGRPEFRNRRVPGAVTVVPTSVMTGRQPVAPAAAVAGRTPAVRELVAAPSRGIPLVAPPVAAPVSVAREPRPMVSPAPRGEPRNEPRNEPRVAGERPGQPLPRIDEPATTPRGRVRPDEVPGAKFDRDAAAAPRNRVEARAEPEPPTRRAAPPPAVPQVQPRARSPRDDVPQTAFVPAPASKRVDNPIERERPAPVERRVERQVERPMPPVERRVERPMPVERRVEIAPPPRAPEVQRPMMPRAPEAMPGLPPAPRAAEARPAPRESRPIDRREERRDRELLLRGKDKDR